MTLMPVRGPLALVMAVPVAILILFGLDHDDVRGAGRYAPRSGGGDRPGGRRGGRLRRGQKQRPREEGCGDRKFSGNVHRDVLLLIGPNGKGPHAERIRRQNLPYGKGGS
jgi:hypothetical protein